MITARTMIKLLSIALLSMAVVAPGAQADAQEDRAESVVKSVLSYTRSTLADGDLSEEEAERLLDYIDTQRVARFTLGRHWRTLSEDERVQFETKFRRYAAEQLRAVLAGIDLGEAEVKNTSLHSSGDTILITKVSAQGMGGDTLRWRVSGSDPHLIIDIEFEGLWIAIEQRAQFQAILDQNGGNVRVLMSQLESKS
jgi:phospholipid transport system substrate-binding protein